MNPPNLIYRHSTRARKLRMQIDPAGKITVVIPKGVPRLFVRQFVQSQERWIQKKLKTIQKKDPNVFYYLGEAHTKAQIMQRAKDDLVAFYKKKAAEVIHDRLQFWNEHYDFTYNRVTFRNQKTRWGSCSRKGNLNFNWRLIMAPIEVIDSVVVHELCHLAEMNHSKNFWALVSQTIPNYKVWRKWLKENATLLQV